MARKKVTTPPRLLTWSDVDHAMKEILESESCVDEIAVTMNRTIAEAKTIADTAAKPAHERIKQLEFDIKEFVVQHRDEIGGKTKQLNFGTTGFRISTKLVLPTVADVLAALKRHKMDDCITVKESVNKDVLKKYKSEDILKVGARLNSSDEFWYEVDKEKIKSSEG